MTLILVIETSSSPFGVVFGHGRNVLFNSPDEASLQGCRDVPLLVDRGLGIIGKSPNDIVRIAVNMGPGGLSSIRSGVAYANALAFALGVAVHPFTSFELSGFEAWKQSGLPVLCTARAVEGNAYVGLFENGHVTKMRYGALDSVAQEVVSELSEFSVVGPHRSLLLDVLSDFGIRDSGIRFGQAKTLLEMEYLIAERRFLYPDIVIPINEETVGIL